MVSEEAARVARVGALQAPQRPYPNVLGLPYHRPSPPSRPERSCGQAVRRRCSEDGRFRGSDWGRIMRRLRIISKVGPHPNGGAANDQLSAPAGGQRRPTDVVPGRGQESGVFGAAGRGAGCSAIRGECAEYRQCAALAQLAWSLGRMARRVGWASPPRLGQVALGCWRGRRRRRGYCHNGLPLCVLADTWSDRRCWLFEPLWLSPVVMPP